MNTRLRKRDRFQNISIKIMLLFRGTFCFAHIMISCHKFLTWNTAWTYWNFPSPSKLHFNVGNVCNILFYNWRMQRVELKTPGWVLSKWQLPIETGLGRDCGLTHWLGHIRITVILQKNNNLIQPRLVMKMIKVISAELPRNLPSEVFHRRSKEKNKWW